MDFLLSRSPLTTPTPQIDKIGANFIKPGKRPLSSMSPSILTNEAGDVVMVVGASGGTKITTSTALVTILCSQLGWSLPDCVDSPRLHHQLR